MNKKLPAHSIENCLLVDLTDLAELYTIVTNGSITTEVIYMSEVFFAVLIIHIIHAIRFFISRANVSIRFQFSFDSRSD